MKVYVLLAQSHGEIMNTEKVFVDETEADQFIDENSKLYSFYKEEKELVLPEENVGTIEEIVQYYRTLVKLKIELELILNDMDETHSKYKEYTDEHTQLEHQIDTFGKQRVLRLKEVDA